MTRTRLRDRGPSKKLTFDVDDMRFTATVSRFPDGRIVELLLNYHKAGNQSDPKVRVADR
jgi:hypothetical protein